ncbi:hypothetical protein BWR11_09185 [Pseudomonas aeruginosa]|jgi:hypothetical protein|nr:hypothetical protein HW04_29605 [Pseudomonas aeruginosa]OHO99591.1 hypothetical protein HMPREF2581_20135 [Pseudomonas sp. HMSC057H01]SAJ24020.1 Uncharacterised protein [Enterobacter cloacae]DAL10627.1 MAG TPA_asm: GTP cyclohydrolase N terminal [Caudoviricetes sp.]ALY76540.1 hypothetical protein HW03_07255 [Pseudomonas aeruginosa]
MLKEIALLLLTTCPPGDACLSTEFARFVRDDDGLDSCQFTRSVLDPLFQERAKERGLQVILSCHPLRLDAGSAPYSARFTYEELRQAIREGRIQPDGKGDYEWLK